MQHLINIVKDVLEGRGAHRVQVLSGGIAYFMLLSLAPLLTLFTALSARFLQDSTEIQDIVFKQIEAVLGADAVTFFQSIIQNETAVRAGGLGWLLGIFIILWVASLVFTRLKDAVDLIWGVTLKDQKTMVADKIVSISQTRNGKVGGGNTKSAPTRKDALLHKSILFFSGVIVWIIRKSVGVLTVLGLGTVLIGTVVATTTISKLEERLPAWVGGGVGQILVGATVIVILSAGITAFFKYVPGTAVLTRAAVPAGLITAVTMTGLNLGFATYLGWATARGVSVGSSVILVFLLWVYLQTQILLSGVELTRAIQQQATGPKAVDNAEL